MGGSDLASEVTSWLEAHWDPALPVEEWWRLVGQAGWSAPHLPVEQGGRGLPRSAERHVRSLFAAYGALRPPGGLGLLMAAPTISRSSRNSAAWCGYHRELLAQRIGIDLDSGP